MRSSLEWAKSGLHISSSPTAALGQQLFCSSKINREEAGRVLGDVCQTCGKNWNKQAQSSCNQTNFLLEKFYPMNSVKQFEAFISKI